MGTVRLETKWSDESLEKDADSALPDPNYPISIRRGRKQSLFLYSIDHLARQMDSLGNSFQPCLEDLRYLYGGDRRRTDQAIKALKGKGLLTRVQVQVLEEAKYVPDILILSQEGSEYLDTFLKSEISRYEEWKQVQPRIKRLLSDPQLQYLNQTKISFFQVRELLKLIVPFLPSSPSLDNAFIATITAFDKTKRISSAEVCQQILGFLDALLRLQGEYIPSEVLRNIAKTLESYGLRVDLTKKKLYSHIQIGARLFGASRNTGRKDLFFKAVVRALEHYYDRFKINEPEKSQIAEINNQLREAGRISLDPEARALGIMGIVIEGLFLAKNRKRFPLPPEMWLAGRDQMHQIRRLFRNSDLKEK
ncbi:MAG: hypothetical protein ACE5OZ_00195 [Candidatus Heimdallarchaeota archaeon]